MSNELPYDPIYDELPTTAEKGRLTFGLALGGFLLLLVGITLGFIWLNGLDKEVQVNSVFPEPEPTTIQSSSGS